MNTKTVNKIATALLLVMFTALVSIITYLVYPVNIISVVQPYKVLNENKEVVRGEKLVYEVEYTKHTDTPAVIYRNVVCDDGNLVTLSPVDSNVPRGEHKIVRSDVVIPGKTSLGMCKLSIVLDYEWSHIRDIRYNFETESFKVIK
jgi:hypothetical protein